MYKVYILQSEKSGRYYIGHTQDLAVRLNQHNSGKVRSTKNYKPWIVIYTESFDIKNEAYKREMEIKSYKSGNSFKELVKMGRYRSGQTGLTVNQLATPS